MARTTISSMAPTSQSRSHICAVCGDGFGSKLAQKQHRRAKHNNPQTAPAPVKPSHSSHFATPYHFIYQGILYSTMVADEQALVRSRLLELCHSEQRLQKEGYTLPIGTAMRTGPQLGFDNVLPFPDGSPGSIKSAAVVLDCEMAGTVDGKDELIRIAVVDFLSGTVLLSAFVNPSQPIQDWRESVTGINFGIMLEAVKRNDALHGWAAARAELWRFVDKNTVLIGQSMRKDLQVLRSTHARIVDTAIVTTDAVLGKKSKIRKRWGLETLCSELLNITIRAPSQPGGTATHDALEDALAARELALMFIRKPDELHHWARATNKTFFTGDKKNFTANKKKGKSSQASGSRSSYSFAYEEDDDGERLRWEDVVDWDTWPKSPPSSD